MYVLGAWGSYHNNPPPNFLNPLPPMFTTAHCKSSYEKCFSSGKEHAVCVAFFS